MSTICYTVRKMIYSGGNYRKCSNSIQCFIDGCRYDRCLPTIKMADKSKFEALVNTLKECRREVALTITYDAFKFIGDEATYIMKTTPVCMTVMIKKFTKYLATILKEPKILIFDPTLSATSISYSDGVWLIEKTLALEDDIVDCFDTLKIVNLGHLLPTRFEGAQFSTIVIPTEPTRLQNEKIMELCSSVKTLVKVEIGFYGSTDRLTLLCDHISNLGRVTDISTMNVAAIPYLQGFTTVDIDTNNDRGLDMCEVLLKNNPNMTSLSLVRTKLTKEVVEYIYEHGVRNGKLIDLGLPKVMYSMYVETIHPSVYVESTIKFLEHSKLYTTQDVNETQDEAPDVSEFIGYINCPEISYSTSMIRAIVPNTVVDMDLVALGSMEYLHCIAIDRSNEFFNNTTLARLAISHCTMNDVEYLLGGINVLTSLRIVNLVNIGKKDTIPTILQINKTVKSLVIDRYNRKPSDMTKINVTDSTTILEHLHVKCDGITTSLYYNMKRNSTLLSLLI